MTKNIIIMAKSKKYNNYCIAGFDVDNGQWVRLVSDDPEISGAVPVEMARYADGTSVEVLDVVKVHIAENGETAATISQRENVFYDSSFVWEKVGQKTIFEVINTYGTYCGNYIFGNTDSYITENGLNGTSLLFTERIAPVIKVAPDTKGVLKARLIFSYNGSDYNLPITDPAICSEYISRCVNTGITEYPLGCNCFAVLSLGCIFNQKYYKLVAQIFTESCNFVVF